jgi:hypothetical protein
MKSTGIEFCQQITFKEIMFRNDIYLDSDLN